DPSDRRSSSSPCRTRAGPARGWRGRAPSGRGPAPVRRPTRSFYSPGSCLMRSFFAHLSSRRPSSRTARRRPRRGAPRLEVPAGRALLSTVLNTDDRGPSSLRDAVQNAAPGDTITFAPSAYGTITLTSGPIFTPFDQPLTIEGPGTENVTVSGGGTSLIFV